MELENGMQADDADFGDFGDFQSSVNTPTESQFNSVIETMKKTNVFELDPFTFKTFMTTLDEELNSYFSDGSSKQLISNDKQTFAIRSQEDLINDCSIWCNLTGSFRSTQPLNFVKSRSFKMYYQALAMDEKTKLKSNESLPVNVKSKEDEEEIANDLDMHSLIIGSVSSRSSSEVADAEQVIEEIENMMTNNKMVKKVEQRSEKFDPLLSLNAGMLLDMALQNFKVNPVSNQSKQSQEEAEEEEGQYYSLPANLGQSDSVQLNSLDDTADSDGLDDSLLALKASNRILDRQLTTAALHTPELSPSPPVHSSPTQVEIDGKLRQLSIVQLNELYMELEQIIQIRSEILIQELALRDELEYEKELKNRFISLLLSVQNKRRHYGSLCNSAHRVRGRKLNRVVRRNSNESNSRGFSQSRSTLMGLALDPLASIGTTIKESLLSSSASQPSPVYLTTVIPYTSSMNPIDIPTLQMLIKLLNALNEDSSTVPSLLTEYILKVICP